MIRRDLYLEKMIDYEDPRFIKIITGIRRAGKSTLLMLFSEYIKINRPDERLLYLNLESFENLSITNDKELADRITNELGSIDSDKHYHVLLDEVQHIKRWERVVAGLQATGQVNVIITGSNAQLLSSEIATLLSGRYVEIEVLPLSFEEFLVFTGKQDTSSLGEIDALFDHYMTYGGFPAVVLTENEQLKLDYLQGLYDSIIVRDIITRHQIKDTSALHRIIRYAYELIGNPIEVRNIINTIHSAGGQISYQTVNSYFSALVDSFSLYPIEQYDLKGKKRLVSGLRYYLADVGLRQVSVPPTAKNRGSILENIVFLELKRRGYKVYAGRIQNYEIDFIAERGDKRIYFQVSESLLNEVTRQREFRSLALIEDNYPKYVLSLDRFDYSDGGIQHLHLIDFLRDKN